MKYFKGIIIVNVIILNSYTHRAGEPTLSVLKSMDQWVSFATQATYSLVWGNTLCEKGKPHDSFSSL